MSVPAGATSPPSLPPALLANRYRLERRLAQGGMAEVWLGVDTQLARQVAVKLLKPGLATDPVVAERFRREAIAVAQLSHPNIVAVYDAIEEAEEGNPYSHRQAVVMQLINGKSLRQLLDEQKRLSPDLTMHIGMCVAAALDEAHRAGLVHRDVKPANILITPDGRVLLTDFGIAKGLESGDDLTSANIMMGTAKYLSPEQVRGKRLDGRADLYSLGLVLYECLAGRVPFLGETDTDTALARLNRDPTDLSRLRPTLPRGLVDLIHRLLARRPDARFATGADVRRELNVVVDWVKANPRLVDPTGTPPVGAPVRPVPRQPTPTSGRPAGVPVRSGDRTPPAPMRPRQQPNRAFDHRPTPSSFVVGGLLLVALILGVLLWNAMTDDGSENGFVPPTTAAVAESAAQADVADAVTAPAAIVGAVSYDPGGDGEEKPDAVNLSIDGNPATSWTSLCYQDRFVNGKGGVGVVVDFGQLAVGSMMVKIDSAPYNVRVFTTDQAAIPASIEAWGDSVFSASDVEPGVVTGTMATPARYALVLLLELGIDGGCTSDNPYRGAVAEITVQ